MPQRLQLSRKRGFRKPPGAIVVSRPSRWGNPFRVGDLVREPGTYGGPAHPDLGVMPEGTYTGTRLTGEPYEYVIRRVRDRADAVNLFRAYIAFHDDTWPPEEIRRELGGRDLCCWCPLPEPGQPDICHAAVLLAVAEGGTP